MIKYCSYICVCSEPPPSLRPPPLFNHTLHISMSLSLPFVFLSVSQNALPVYSLSASYYFALFENALYTYLSLWLPCPSLSLLSPTFSSFVSLRLHPLSFGASYLLLYLFVFTVPFSLFSSSFYVCHSMSVILCLSSYVCHSMSAILCLSFYACHPMSAILCLPSMSVILCLPSLGPSCLRSPLCRPYPSPRLPCALQLCRYL